MKKISNMKDFWQNLGVPESCYAGKRLFKKLFYDHGNISAAGKKAFAEDIERIHCLYILKPAKVNIPKVENKNHEYTEIAILEINLSSGKRLERIATAVQRAIPYPILVVFVCGRKMAISAADKRINRADANKVVAEKMYDTGWINFSALTKPQRDFLADFRIKRFSYRNLLDFYQDAVGRIIALNCATHSGKYEATGTETKPKRDRLKALQEMEIIDKEKAEIRSQLRREKHLGAKVSLNTRMKHLNDRSKDIRAGI